MEGRSNGDHVPWSRSHSQTTRGSSSSSGYNTSGTIVSTSYSSNGSGMSSFSLDLEASIHLDELDEDNTSRPTKKSRKGIETSKEKQNQEEMYQQEIAKNEMKGIEILVQSFLKVEGGDMSVLRWWLRHLGVGWLLHIADDYASGGNTVEKGFHHAKTWIRALTKISKIIRSMEESLCPCGHDSAGLPTSSTCAEEQQPGKTTGTVGEDSTILDLFHFAQFIQEAMLKLLVFVDVIVEYIMSRTCQRLLLPLRLLEYSALADLTILLRLHNALSEALSAVGWLFRSLTTGGVEDKVVSILSAKKTKAAEAIRSTMKQIWKESIEDCDNTSFSLDTQGSSKVHRATRFVIRYIRLLCGFYRSAAAIMCKEASLGKYVRQTRDLTPLNGMFTEIASSLQKTLANRSQSFLDHGLRFLFLLNNSHFIRQELHYNTLLYSQEEVAILFGKAEGYMESYLEVSWAPVLSILFNPTHLRFGKNYFLLPKFESKFLKTYITQKMWKVPDPELRKTLRKAIIEKIIPGYTKYIEDNKINTPKFSPQKLKEMLQELFEGW